MPRRLRHVGILKVTRSNAIYAVCTVQYPEIESRGDHLRIVTTAYTDCYEGRFPARRGAPHLRTVNFASCTLHMHASAETKSSTYGDPREAALFTAAVSGFRPRQHIIPPTDYFIRWQITAPRPSEYHPALSLRPIKRLLSLCGQTIYIELPGGRPTARSHLANLSCLCLLISIICTLTCSSRH